MNKLFFLFVVGVILSCTNEQNSDSLNLVKQPQTVGTLTEDQMEPERTTKPRATTEEIHEQASKIIKSGSLEFEVSDLDKSKRTIDSLLVKYDSYYENEQYNAHHNRISYALLIRIPSLQFDPLLRNLEDGIGKLTDKDVNVKDVTGEYVDLNIRLENNLAYLKQYQEILKKAVSIKEILEVQGKVRRIEEEIESKKGRINYLNSKVKYSTLQLTISESIDIECSNQPPFGRRISNAFNNGIGGFLNVLIGLVNIWPFLIIIVLSVLFKSNIIQFFKR